MISSHVYSAFLIGAPDRELSLRGGQITLDDTTAPHVQGGIEIAWPGHWEIVPDDLPITYGGLVWVRDDEVLDALDPKITPRVRVEVDGVYPSFSVHREFDLGVRSRNPDQVSGVVQLELASDEALLDDYRTLEDDDTPFALAASLRDVVDYVLGKVIPGAALDASPAGDADMSPYWSVTNLMPNPAVRGIVGNWVAGGASGSLIREAGHAAGSIPAAADVTTATLTTWVGNSGVGQGGAFGQTATVTPYVTCRPFTEYTVSVWVFSSVAKQLRLLTQVFGADGALLDSGTAMPFEVYDAAGVRVSAAAPAQNIPAATWLRLVGRFTTPANAARLGPFVYPGTAVQWVNTNSLRTTAWMVHERWYPVPVPYFDGATPATTRSTYTASGAPHESASVRTPVGDAVDPDALIWKAGQTALEFLAPLVQASGYRLVCDEARQWTLRDEDYIADGSLNIRYGVNMIDGSDTIDRDSGLWFDAQVTRYRDTRDGGTREWVDSYALNDPPSRVKLVEIDAAYPGPGRSEYAVRRAQGLGREVTVSAVARWTEHAEQSITVTLNGAPIQAGRTSRVVFNLGPGDSRDRVTVTTRSTDVSPNAIDLLAGTVNELVGSINDLP